jgi:uncharacterized protein YcbX
VVSAASDGQEGDAEPDLSRRGPRGGPRLNAIVGRVTSLHRYPVKSMAGEPLDAAELRWRGIHGDRQYGFVHRGNLSRFPWFTGRDLSDLVRYQARFRDPADPRGSPVEVTAPDGTRFVLEGPDLRERLGAPVELVQFGRGTFDAMPVSLTTTATLAAVDAAHGAPLDRQRFRINIVIDSDLREESWGERLLEFGDETGPRLLLQEPIARCVMITIDPESGARSPTLMRTVVRDFDNQVGFYASPARLGSIRIGDAVRLL